MFSIVVLVQLFIAMKCVRERVVLGAVIASFVSRLVSEVVPGAVSPDGASFRVTRQALWVLATVISISMLVSSIRLRISRPK